MNKIKELESKYNKELLAAKKEILIEKFNKLSESQQKFLLKIYQIESINDFMKKHSSKFKHVISQMDSSIKDNIIVNKNLIVKFEEEIKNLKSEIESYSKINIDKTNEIKELKLKIHELESLKTCTIESTDGIEISKQQYFNMLVNELILNRLEAGGIDNWEWYGESLNPDGKFSLEEEESIIYKKIFGRERG